MQDVSFGEDWWRCLAGVCFLIFRMSGAAGAQHGFCAPGNLPPLVLHLRFSHPVGGVSAFMGREGLWAEALCPQTGHHFGKRESGASLCSLVVMAKGCRQHEAGDPAHPSEALGRGGGAAKGALLRGSEQRGGFALLAARMMRSLGSLHSQEFRARRKLV